MTCFHCGEIVSPGTDIFLYTDGRHEPMCCYGCLAVAESIIHNGLGDYYQYRTSNSITPDFLDKGYQDQIKLYDRPEIQKSFVETKGLNHKQANLLLGEIVCPACVWLIEKHVSKLPGIIQIAINYSNHQAKIEWDDEKIQLGKILEAIAKIGYSAWPYTEDSESKLFEIEKKKQLTRIGLAGLLGMQVMMISIALYLGNWSQSEQGIRHFLLWVSLILATPVVAYSAWPFFSNALRGLTYREINMDLPVSLGLVLAYLGSMYATISHQGQTYYDSVVMLVFFLLVARYIEFMARKKSREQVMDINRVIPVVVTRMNNDGRKVIEETVPVIDLVPGDIILVRPGQRIPADGMITEGQSSLNEAVLTGESYPVKKTVNANVLCGSFNIDSPLKIKVKNTGAETVYSRITQLAEKAALQKPRLTGIANEIAVWFVLAVIIISCLVAWYWWLHDPEIWLPATIAVLVATCPCALALAAPTALTNAINTLLKNGVATRNHDSIEKIYNCTDVIFDKTGTLTYGRLMIEQIDLYAGLSEEECLQIAATLELQSEHPVALAFRERAASICDNTAIAVVNYPGEGISGTIDHCNYFAGTAAFITKSTGIDPWKSCNIDQKENESISVILSDQKRILAVFSFRDITRPGVGELISFLDEEGKNISLLSGDNRYNVEQLADNLGISSLYFGVLPSDKLQILRDLQDQGRTITAIGDGINDAPLLAAADASIAMNNGAELAKIKSDMIMLNDNLSNLKKTFAVSIKTFGIIKQNIFWAVFYNLSVIPVAASGILTPWMAAIGMSLSSMLVIGNASRIR